MDAAKYPQLSAIDSPKQLRRLPLSMLGGVASELRATGLDGESLEHRIVLRCRPRARAAYPSPAAGGWN
jgi:hypothetical protein